MTVEELLKPRYKVIADYPYNPVEVGELECSDTEEQGKFLDQFPHLFKKLEWWEERKECDMPEYVKSTTLIGRAYKISDANEKYEYGFMIDYPMSEHHVLYKDTLPITKEEYEIYFIGTLNR